MAKFPAQSPRLQFIDDDGVPLVGGKLYTYAAGGTTPITTYTDSTGGSSNTNPIILDVYGEADVWLTLQQQYKFVLKDSLDNTIWTIDNIGYDTIFDENITWTGNHTFSGTVTLGAVSGTVTFAGAVTMSSSLHVVGTLAVDGAASFNGDIAADSFTGPLFTVTGGGAIGTTGGALLLTSNNNITVTTDLDGTPRSFDHQTAGYLRLPRDGTNALDAATVGQVAAAIAAALAAGGRIPWAMGAVVSNALVSGSIGVASVAHPSAATYTITLSSATTSTGKTLVFTTPRYPSPLRGYEGFPVVNSTTEIGITTGGGNTWTAQDLDFNFVVYSLP